ncbi:MAG TPA: efflux RND transporter periplasmic adaptor subunit [Pseudomonadales bacterium]|nr:efflux RND transporter periplasmic adaptor subunit [Pseudomonadales bacterium]
MKKTYLLATLIITVMSLWMLSGIFKSDTPHDSAQDATAEQTGVNDKNSDAGVASVARVRTRHLVAELQRIEIVLRGRTEAKRVVDIKAETGGRVIAVPVEKGQQVKAGDVLCELAEDGRRAQLSQTQAAFEKASIDYEGGMRLKKDGLLSNTSMAASKSALESARAALKMAELDVEHLQMRAAFAGFVEDRPAEVGVLMDRGAICARLLDEASLLATGQASEREVAPLVLGQPVIVQLTSGEHIDGAISFISRAADPKTRTYRIEARLNTNGVNVRDGITARITIPLQEVVAHRITPAVLALDDSGRVGVRIINAQQRVEFHHVEVVRETAEGVWVTGLPPEINLITVGQEMVADGDKVDATPDNSVSQDDKHSEETRASTP